MSQSEPYVVIHRSADGVKTGRNFATIAAARRYAKLGGYNTIAQKKRGHAGLTIVETVALNRERSGPR